MKISKISGIVVFLIVLGLIPWLITNQYFLRIINLILLYSVLTLSLNLIAGFAGVLSFGHAAFYGIGAFTTALLMTRLNVPFLPAIVAAGLVSFLFGVLLGIPSLRVKGDYLCLVTIGFGEIVRIVLQNWISLTGGQAGIAGIPFPKIFFLELTTGADFYYLALCILFFSYLTMSTIAKSKIGRALLALREDELVASTMGINSFYYRIMAFSIGTFFAGLAGSYMAVYVSFVAPSNFTLDESCLIMIMVIVGGITSLPGSIIGATTMIIATEVFRQVAQYRIFIIGLMMVLVLVFFPQGITGLLVRYRLNQRAFNLIWRLLRSRRKLSETEGSY